MDLVFSAALRKGTLPQRQAASPDVQAMNKKKNPDLVRNIHYLLRLNKIENDAFVERVKMANGMKPIDFLRKLSQETIIIAPQKKEELAFDEKLLSILIEYRNNFKRLSNLIKAHDPGLNNEIEALVRSIQRIIDKV
ncbi:MAG: hypothetical protein JSS79_18140 [Bacteroidetes bacterium]|nr:hypothetical protein [Bacteroidota bacterium]